MNSSSMKLKMPTLLDAGRRTIETLSKAQPSPLYRLNKRQNTCTQQQTNRIAWQNSHGYAFAFSSAIFVCKLSVATLRLSLGITHDEFRTYVAEESNQRVLPFFNLLLKAGVLK